MHGQAGCRITSGTTQWGDVAPMEPGLAMLMDATLTTSLQAVGAVMATAHDPWWVIASAAVALHGADPGPVSDIDVLLSAGDAGRILPTIGVTALPGDRHPDFRSDVFGRWHGPALSVEFMADFHYRSAAGWVRVQPATRQCIEIAGVALFVPARAELRRLLVAFGRPKDLERARALR